MTEWICTFGFGHTHPVTGESLASCFVRVQAPTVQEAHEVMNARFGLKWACCYESEKRAGIQRFSMREVPLPDPLVKGDSDASFSLIQITDELAEISRQQHALERRKTILREAATKLRTGQDPRAVAAAVDSDLRAPERAWREALLDDAEAGGQRR